MDVDEFIARWSSATISERSHYQTFISQLCALIGVPAPDEERVGDMGYCFERPVEFVHDDGRIKRGSTDCYREGAFVLEAKQSEKRRAGGDLDPLPHLALLAGRRRSAPCGGALERVMLNAKRQAEGYAKALDEWPPFLMVVDVGRCIDLWADFNRQGKGYAPFPDRARYRIQMTDLRHADVRERLRRAWLDPMSLNPEAHVAKVTTEIGERLAWLMRSISQRTPHGEDGQVDPVVKAARASQTALFVMQCIFAMFADSVDLIEKRGFLKFLKSYRGHAHEFHLGAADLFRRMDKGGYCSAIRQSVPSFKGGLFQHSAALPITESELEALIKAAKLDWASVEPAIFGALLERALDPDERAELGAHYTPKAYVRRLVEATIMEPLRADWLAGEAAAVRAYVSGDVLGARRIIRKFHTVLCNTQVLDPACGTGNFLYVAMDMMKDLESEVLTSLADLGERQDALGLNGHTISPEQFWGIEKNSSAVWIAEMVMWIGYLQWHFRTSGKAMPSQPIRGGFNTINQVDALITSDREEPRRDVVGRPVTRVRAKRNSRASANLFGARHQEREVMRLINPRATQWPPVDFIIGNPPFIGGKDLRAELGDGYVDALWQVRKGRFRSADLVTAWWDRAAEILTASGSRLRRFGFITTNSITQPFSRRVLEHHLHGGPPMRLTFAIPDHPWIKGSGRADVRIAMTVAERGLADGQGLLLTVIDERASEGEAPEIAFREQRGIIGPDLTIGGGARAEKPLRANALLCSAGVKLHGSGFIVSEARASALLAASAEGAESPIRAFCSGRDLAQRSRDARVIDLFGWLEGEARRRHPAIFQYLLETVKPDRDLNNRATYRDNWWIFGEPRSEFRPALEGLSRYIATAETSKHRWFRFLDADVTADNTIIAVASDDARVLGVLSSRIHGLWALARGGSLEDRPVYTKTACFDAFPFPDFSGAAGNQIGELALEIDDLRAKVLLQHPSLTMTALYNVRERIMRSEVLSPEDEAVRNAGLLGLLHHLHERLDRAVAEAYGWAPDLNDAEILIRLMALHRERAEEEARGEVRFLRPDYQQRRVAIPLGMGQIEAPLMQPVVLPPLPHTAEGLAGALLEELNREGGPLHPLDLARRFEGQPGRHKHRITQTLAVLAVAGSVQHTDLGWFSPRPSSIRP